MAIQMRRGNLVNYDEDKMLPGEFGVATDEEELYIAFGTGNSKRVLTENDFDNIPSAICFGTSDTAGTTSEKAVTVLDDSFELVDGALLIVRFSHANTSGAMKFNINGTGAKKAGAYSNGDACTSPRITSNTPTMFRFAADKDRWELVSALPLITHLRSNYLSNSSADVDGRYYAVKQDLMGFLSVCVPWTDTHGTLTATDQGDGIVQLSLT